MSSKTLGGTSPAAAWRKGTGALIARFQKSAVYGSDRQRVEALIIELASEYLLVELGERAAWDAFDVQGWRDTALTLDDGYRRRCQTTFAELFDFLAASGDISAVANTRIQEEIAQCLSDLPQAANVRQSFLRGAGTPETELANAQLSSALKATRR